MSKHFGVLVPLFVALLAGCQPALEAVGVNGAMTQMAGVASVEECPNGGVVFEHGIDTNESGELDQAEVTKTYVVCHGANGSDADATAEIAALREELSALKTAVALNTAKVGISQEQASTMAVNNYIVSNLPDFSNWDKNAVDDFNGDYTALMNKPATISQPQAEAIVVNSLKVGFPGFGVVAGKALEGTFTEMDPVATAKGYAAESWVLSKNYLITEVDPVATTAGYASENWVMEQGYGIAADVAANTDSLGGLDWSLIGCRDGFNGPKCIYSDAVTCSGHGVALYDGSCLCKGPIYDNFYEDDHGGWSGHRCTDECGDGIIQVDEFCDDGADNGGDEGNCSWGCREP